MTDLSITAAQVLPVTDSTLREFGTAGAAITAGQVVYLDATTNTYKLFDANDSAANTGTPRLALTGAASGQPIVVAIGGSVTLGAAAAPTRGTVYVASANAGGIAPAADLTTGWKNAIVGIGDSSNRIKLALSNSGITV